MTDEELILADLMLERLTLGQPVNTYPFVYGLIRPADMERFGEDLYSKLHTLTTYGGVTVIRKFLSSEGYITCTNPSNPSDVLTDKGREAQKAGGHKNYLNQLEQQRIEREKKEKEQTTISWPQKHWLLISIATFIFTFLGEALIQYIFSPTQTQTTPQATSPRDTVTQYVYDTVFVVEKDTSAKPITPKHTK